MKALLLLLLCSTPLSISAETTEERIAKLELRVKALEEKIQMPDTESKAAPVPVAASGLISLAAWNHSFSVTKYEEPGYKLGIKIKNGYTKATKLIDGSCVYKDALGEVVFSVALDKDVKLTPGEAKEIGGFYPFNRFENKSFRLRNMTRDDVTVTLVIRRVVFADNTVLEVQK